MMYISPLTVYPKGISLREQKRAAGMLAAELSPLPHGQRGCLDERRVKLVQRPSCWLQVDVDLHACISASFTVQGYVFGLDRHAAGGIWVVE